MPHYSTAVTLPHRSDNLFELVSDIERYPDFIRWIRSMAVRDRRETGDGVITCLGDASVGFRGVSERFATRVTADPNTATIHAELVRGPFRKLDNHWALQATEDGRTRIDFTIDYEFSNPVLKLLARSHFNLAVNRLMDAFIAEADRRYDKVAQAI